MEDTTFKPTKHIDMIGQKLYGETFTGYQVLAEYRDLLAAFKDFYYAERLKNPNANVSEIIRGFNKEHCQMVGRKFHPAITQVGKWKKQWDLDLLQQMGLDVAEVEKKRVPQVVKTRDEDGVLVISQVGEDELEQGVRTLGGELMNDAMQMLRDDQEIGEIYDDEVLIKRRNYIVNVFAHITKLVHGKAALMLKASEEKRNTAGFLLSLISRATAGKMTDDEMGLLKNTYRNAPIEATVVENNVTSQPV